MTKDQADDVVRVASSYGADAMAEERDGDYVVTVGTMFFYRGTRTHFALSLLQTLHSHFRAPEVKLVHRS